MVQHVATVKPEIAAFTTNMSPNSFTNSESNEQFGRLLQDQKSEEPLASKSESVQNSSSNNSSSNNSSSKNTLQESTDEIEKVSTSTTIEGTANQTKSTLNEHTDIHDLQKSSLSQDNIAIQYAIESSAFDESEFVVANTKGESADGIDPVVAQEWVSLVDNLQKLADVVQPKKTPEVLQDLISQLNLVTQKDGTEIVDQKTLDTTIDNLIKKDSILINQQNETLSIDLESVTVEGELLEKDISMVQSAPSNLPNSGKIEKVAANNDIKNILNLSESNLDKVLENIAQQVFDNKKLDEPLSSIQTAQQVIIPKAAEIISSVESPSKDFISALKTGLEEFKNQLSQGREPGIDLKALVSDALAKTSDSGGSEKAPVNLEQVLKSVSQVLDSAQAMKRALEHNHDQTYSNTSVDVAQIQGEQSKQIQLNQFESKPEKAINIAKPEGHQQLAEKVRWMVNTKNLIAEIRLDPAELGSLHVKVAVYGESATVNFVVQTQQARDAVDNATPRLREMLAEKGIELGQSSVRQENDGRQSQGDGELTKHGGPSTDEAEDIDISEQVLTQQNIVNGALGGIDYFV
jgi:flagellar hook-length control protein FliK